MNQPSVRFDHLQRMTDDTGIVEHAVGAVPRRKEGYSTDDQARALWACQEWIGRAHGEDVQRLDELSERYVSFLLWAQKEDGHFHNNFAYNRSKELEKPSDDCVGRCLWACAQVISRNPKARYAFAANIVYRKAMRQLQHMRYPRGWAFALAAIGLMYKSGAELGVDSAAEMLIYRLDGMYRMNRSSNWHWYEAQLTYSNGVLPWGMLWAFELTNRQELLEKALESLDFLIHHMSGEAGQVRPIGSNGWGRPDFRAQWDQQPIDVMKLALASVKAYELTQQSVYKDVVSKCRAWFHGDNDLETPLVDPSDGSCCDGLQAGGMNENRGAEAVISYLLTEAIYRQIHSIQGP